MTKKDLQQLSFSALQELPEAVFWFDKNAKLFDVNQIACKKWGYTKEELLQLDITDIFVELKGVVYSCAIIRDITDRKEANKIARLSDFTIQKAGDSIFWVHPGGEIKQVNENACKRYGY